MTPSPTLTPTNSSSMPATSAAPNGALGTYKITLWIIVLTWTVFSMAMILGSA